MASDYALFAVIIGDEVATIADAILAIVDEMFIEIADAGTFVQDIMSLLIAGIAELVVQAG